MSEDPQAPDLPYTLPLVGGVTLSVDGPCMDDYVVVEVEMAGASAMRAVVPCDRAAALARAVLAGSGSDARVVEGAPQWDTAHEAVREELALILDSHGWGDLINAAPPEPWVRALVRAARSAPDPDARECGDALPEDAPDGPRVCTLAPEHGGDHRDAEGVSWREMTPREIAAARPQAITLPLHMWSLILDKADRADRADRMEREAAHSGSEQPGALDLDAISDEWLSQCGPCEHGVTSAACSCPPGDYRPVMLRLVDEVERLTEESSRLARQVDEARTERDDYQDRLRGTDQSWSRLAAERDQAREEAARAYTRGVEDARGLAKRLARQYGAQDLVAMLEMTDLEKSAHDPDALADPPGPSRCQHCVPGDGVWVHTAPARRCANADDTGAAGILGRLDRTAHPIARRLEDLIRAVADHEARLAALEDATDLGPDSQGEDRTVAQIEQREEGR